MSIRMDEALSERLQTLASSCSGLDLLILFGSRSRGDAGPSSDWDFAFLGERGMDVDRLLGQLVRLLGTERVDLVDLSRAGGLLRFRVARDGATLFERSPGIFSRFWLDAVSFWCDAAPALSASYERLLRALTP
jgi:predicted nucleotidyltransferase